MGRTEKGEEGETLIRWFLIFWANPASAENHKINQKVYRSCQCFHFYLRLLTSFRTSPHSYWGGGYFSIQDWISRLENIFYSSKHAPGGQIRERFVPVSQNSYSDLSIIVKFINLLQHSVQGKLSLSLSLPHTQTHTSIFSSVSRAWNMTLFTWNALFHFPDSTSVWVSEKFGQVYLAMHLPYCACRWIIKLMFLITEGHLRAK